MGLWGGAGGARGAARETIWRDGGNGTMLWRKAAPALELEKSMHEFSSPAASTPATDGARVYVYLGGYGALAYKWRKSVPADVEGNMVSYRWLLFTMFDSDKDGVFTPEDWKEVKEFTAKNKSTMLAVRPGGSGNVSKSHVAWKGMRGIPDVPSPLNYRGRLFLVMDGGMLTSYDSRTGKLVMDRERVGLASQFV